jgi:hypothetical protein
MLEAFFRRFKTFDKLKFDPLSYWRHQHYFKDMTIRKLEFHLYAGHVIRIEKQGYTETILPKGLEVVRLDL